MVNNRHKYVENFNKQTMRLRCAFLVFKLKTGDMPKNLQAKTNHIDVCNVHYKSIIQLVKHVRRIYEEAEIEEELHKWTAYSLT